MQPKNQEFPSKKAKIQKPTVQQAVFILIIMVVSFFGGWLGSIASNQIDRNRLNTDQARQVVSEQSELISQIAEEVGPSVVSVNVLSESVQDSVFGPQVGQQQSAGTGFIISESGYIVTNRHVVPKGTTEVSVTLSDGTELDKVKVVGRTNEGDSLDVAFLKVTDSEGKKLKPAKLGDSSEMIVGSMVVAIGNALGQFQNTVTSGILSGYGRSVEAAGDSGQTESLQNLFQTDAAINQGNSGGPLVNANGEVIAINTAVAGGGAENIGFAIPINDVKGLINSVLKEGKLLRPYLGVRYVTLTDDLNYQYNLPEGTRGAYIVPSSRGNESVISGSPAAKARLQEKDIITKIGDSELSENTSLSSALGAYTVGDTVKVTFIRDGQEQTVDVTLEALE